MTKLKVYLFNMQISLLPEEVDYIYSLAQADVKKSNWVRTHILNKIEAKWHEAELNSKCQHQEGRYVGFKTCCTKCGSYFIEGQGEKWEILPEKENK